MALTTKRYRVGTWRGARGRRGPSCLKGLSAGPSLGPQCPSEQIYVDSFFILSGVARSFLIVVVPGMLDVL